MENDEENRLGKKFGEKKGEGGEVDFRTKSGTAWSHNFLNQKPWHPLSYPNQRRKWIAEQTHAQKSRRAEEVSREYAQEQEFFRQAAMVSKKEKEKLETMKAVSFMYVRPPGYNPESAKAAEVADEQKKHEQDLSVVEESTSIELEAIPEKKKQRAKDVFGRTLPTEEQFEVLKNAPKMETGIAGRPKPFGIEIRNVKCLRCGNFGHQSGDRECPLKDVITSNEENRLKRDDPLTAILAQTESGEPLKWELKQQPGLSPPRGGFDIDDPNQQIVAEDIYDEYGGFLASDVSDLLANLSGKRKKEKRRLSPIKGDEEENESSSEDDKRSRRRKSKKRHRKEKQRSKHKKSRLSLSDQSESDDELYRRNKHKHKDSSYRECKRRSRSSSSDRSKTDEQYRCKHRNERGDVKSRNDRVDLGKGRWGD